MSTWSFSRCHTLRPYIASLSNLNRVVVTGTQVKWHFLILSVDCVCESFPQSIGLHKCSSEHDGKFTELSIDMTPSGFLLS